MKLGQWAESLIRLRAALKASQASSTTKPQFLAYIPAMASVLTVANRLLELAEAQGKSLTPLQLMKLAYMSNGWSLGLNGRALFNDAIEAWKYGPVIPTLYHQTKGFGSGPIKETLRQPTGEKLDAQAEELLQSVMNTYGSLSGAALSNLTHREGSPWKKVWRDGVSHLEIPTEVIREHYQGLKDSPTIKAA
jgi:uncharacterized phage-associated protein